MNTASQVPWLFCRVRWVPCKKIWRWRDSPLGDTPFCSQSLLALPGGLGILSYIRWYKTRPFCLCIFWGKKTVHKMIFWFLFLLFSNLSLLPSLTLHGSLLYPALKLFQASNSVFSSVLLFVVALIWSFCTALCISVAVSSRAGIPL